MKKMMFSLLLALLAVLALPSVSQAQAAEEVSYIDYQWDEATQTLTPITKTITDYTLLTSNSSTVDIRDSVLVVKGEVSIGRLFLESRTDNLLILTDGSRLTIRQSLQNGYNTDAALTICGQAEGTGSLYINGISSYRPDYDDYQFGGAAEPRRHGYGLSAGDIIINGGNIVAYGGDAGGHSNAGSYRITPVSMGISTFNLTINGGNVVGIGSHTYMSNFQSSSSGQSLGISVHRLTVHGGTVRGVGGNVTLTHPGLASYYANSTGIQVTKDLTVTGGTLEGIGGYVKMDMGGFSTADYINSAVGTGSSADTRGIFVTGGGPTEMGCTTFRGGTIIARRGSGTLGGRYENIVTNRDFCINGNGLTIAVPNLTLSDCLINTPITVENGLTLNGLLAEGQRYHNGQDTPLTLPDTATTLDKQPSGCYVMATCAHVFNENGQCTNPTCSMKCTHAEFNDAIGRCVRCGKDLSVARILDPSGLNTTYHQTLSAACAALVEGETLSLTKTTSASVTLSRSCTVDLAGFALKGDLTVSGGNVTLQDSSADGTGEIRGALTVIGGTVTLSGGRYGSISVPQDQTCAALLAEDRAFVQVSTFQEVPALTQTLSNVIVLPHTQHTTINDRHQCVYCGRTMPLSLHRDTEDLYFPNLASAFSAAQPGETITLLQNSASDGAELNKSLTLALNGHTLSQKSGQVTVKADRQRITLTLTGPGGLTIPVSLRGSGSSAVAAMEISEALTLGSVTVEQNGALRVNGNVTCSSLAVDPKGSATLYQGTYGSLSHSSGVSKLLVEKKAYYLPDESRWLPLEDGASSLSNAKVLEAPIQDAAINASENNQYVYNTPLAFLTQVTQPAGQNKPVSYQWWVEDTAQSETSATLSLTSTPDVGQRQVSCVFSVEGYEIRRVFSFRITPALLVYTAPTAPSLTYAGQPIPLLTSGSVQFGTFYYRLDQGSWSSQLPTGKVVGDYSLSWYIKSTSENYLSLGSPSDPAGELTASVLPRSLAETASPTLVWTQLDPPFYNGTTQSYRAALTLQTSSGELLETLTPGTDYTLSGTTSAIAAGSYSLTLAGHGNYTGTLPVSWQIQKAPAPTPRSASLTIYNRLERYFTFDFATLLPQLPAGMEYGSVNYRFNPASGGKPENSVIENRDYFGQNTGLRGSVFSLDINAVDTATEGNVATFRVSVLTDNYQDILLSLPVNALNRRTPVGSPTLSAATLPYGQSISTVTLSGSLHDPKTPSQTVPGTFTWVAPEQILPAGEEQAVSWTFTPTVTDGLYLPASGTSYLTVLPAVLTGVSVTPQGSMTFSDAAQTPRVTTAATAVNGQNVTFLYAADQAGPYGTMPTVTNAGTYTIYYKATAPNHTDRPGQFTVTVEPMRLEREKLLVAAADRPYDGTDNATVSLIYDQNTIIRPAHYTVTQAQFETASAGENKTVSVALTLDENYLCDGSPQIQATTLANITKALSSARNGILWVKNGETKDYTLDLSSLLAPLPQGKTYGLVQSTISDDLSPSDHYAAGSAKVDQAGLLTLPIRNVTTDIEGKLGQLTLLFTTENYQDMTSALEIFTVNKTPLSGTPTPSQQVLTYGQPLSSLSLSGTVTDLFTGAAVAGTFRWADPALVPTAGLLAADWLFTPSDEQTYAPLQGTLYLTVNPALLPMPVFRPISGPGRQLSEVNWSLENVAAELTWDLGESTLVEQGKAYSWTLTPADSHNFYPRTGSYVPWPRPSSGGSSSSTAKNEDGSTTKTETRRDGTVVETTQFPDGTVITKNTTKTGTTATKTVDKDGTVTEHRVTVSPKDAQSKEPVVLPVEEVVVNRYGAAAKLEVDVPPNSQVTVEIPVEAPTPGTVIIQIHPDGTETILLDGRVTELGLCVTLTDSSTLKITDHSKDFSDVSDDSYYSSAVDWASARGITGGTSETTFSPEDSCSRSQLVTLLWRMAGSQGSDTSGDFHDVSRSAFYTDAVSWAAEKGIVTGYGDGRFGTDDTVTREQMAVMLYRFAQTTDSAPLPDDTSASEFADFGSVSPYAAEAMEWAIRSGILQGYRGSLMPHQTCTRGQIVTMLYRFTNRSYS